MNSLSRELSNILTSVLSVEHSILQKLLAVRQMEQAEEVYTNRGEHSMVENPELGLRPPSPGLPPPPRPDRTHLAVDHTSIIKPGASCLAGKDSVSKMFNKRPSFQGEAGSMSTLQRTPARMPHTKEGGEPTKGITSTLGQHSVRSSVRYHSQPLKPLDTTVDSVHSGYIEDIILSRNKKTKVIKRYVILLFAITNISLVGLSVLGTLMTINNVDYCNCSPSQPALPGPHSLKQAGFVSPDQDSLKQAGFAAPRSVSPDQRLTLHHQHNGRDFTQGQTGPGVKAGLSDKTGPGEETDQDADYSIHIVIENNKTKTKTVDDGEFWAY